MENPVDELVRLVARLVKEAKAAPGGGWVIPWADGLLLTLLMEEIEDEEERVRIDRAVMKAVTEAKAGKPSECTDDSPAQCLEPDELAH